MCEPSRSMGGHLPQEQGVISDPEELIGKISTILGIKHNYGDDTTIPNIIKKLREIQDAQTRTSAKECPLCGYLPFFGRLPTGEYIVKCHKCCGQIQDSTLGAAIHKWNALPRDLQWTTERPTREGWYWGRESPEVEPQIIYHCEPTEYRILMEFAGPIPLPKESKND